MIMAVNITPKEQAKIIFLSNGLSFNPYDSGSAEHMECADELLRLTTEANNAKV